MPRSAGIHEIPLSRVRQFSFHHHHVVPGAQSSSLQQVADLLVGLHSARLQTPYVALHARVTGFANDHLRHETCVARRFIKLRCMRRTLHTVPLALAPVVHQATLDLRLADCHRMHRKLGLASREVQRLEWEILRTVEEGPLSSAQIEARVATAMLRLTKTVRAGAEPRLRIRAVLRSLWERGDLCYLNLSEHWGSEVRLYGATQREYPDLTLSSITREEAQMRLVQVYVDGYGPALEEDFVWWSGLSLRKLRRHLQETEGEIVRLRIRELDGDFLMSRAHFETLRDFKLPRSPWLRLLAYEDPSLKGYHASRARYVEESHYSKLFNRIGEARASIILNGSVIGCWHWDKAGQRIVSEPFDTLNPEAGMMLADASAELAARLRGTEPKPQEEVACRDDSR